MANKDNENVCILQFLGWDILTNTNYFFFFLHFFLVVLYCCHTIAFMAPFTDDFKRLDKILLRICGMWENGGDITQKAAVSTTV